eukprot:314992_1
MAAKIALYVLLILAQESTSSYINPQLFVTKEGCDIGTCLNNDTDYSNECLILSNTSEIYETCCSPKSLFENKIRQSTNTNTTSETPAPTCLTFDYAYQCLFGYNSNYTGSGTIHIDQGVFSIHNPINLYNNTSLTIQGRGVTQSTVNYKTWFGCDGQNNHLTIRDISLASVTSANSSIWEQISFSGCILEFENVLFDGKNNIQTTSYIWKFVRNSTLIFRSCVFKNNDVKYLFDGVNATFIDSIFKGNILTTHNENFESDDAMFYITNHSSLSFVNCTFIKNSIQGRALFTIISGSLIITNTTINNHTTGGWLLRA